MRTTAGTPRWNRLEDLIGAPVSSRDTEHDPDLEDEFRRELCAEVEFADRAIPARREMRGEMGRTHSPRVAGALAELPGVRAGTTLSACCKILRVTVGGRVVSGSQSSSARDRASADARGGLGLVRVTHENGLFPTCTDGHK